MIDQPPGFQKSVKGRKCPTDGVHSNPCASTGVVALLNIGTGVYDKGAYSNPRGFMITKMDLRMTVETCLKRLVYTVSCVQVNRVTLQVVLPSCREVPNP